ncbi:MAG: gfo/Idh/MocA family oxidoreductase, partial [Verrucomicrobia bacterium]|nr:gfo/Idh/MocA family oxidoreductase [Verrucomicrobiota bacterium]
MSTKKIRIALAGLGFGAEFIPIYLAHPNAEIVALCQRNPAKLKEIGDRYKISKRYTDF